jgi:hypothetical protein
MALAPSIKRVPSALHNRSLLSEPGTLRCARVTNAAAWLDRARPRFLRETAAVAKATQSESYLCNVAAILLPSSNQIRATLFEDGRSH